MRGIRAGADDARAGVVIVRPSESPAVTSTIVRRRIPARVRPPLRMNDLVNTATEHARLVRKLELVVPLTAAERQALLDVPMTVRSYGADQDIAREGTHPSECCLILDGFACRYKLLSDGRRQILSFHTPGDVPDLHSVFMRVMDHSLGTLAPTRAVFMAHEHVSGLMYTYPGIGAALWHATLVDAAILRELVVSLGRRSAHQRVAHQLCELVVRLEAVGLAGKQSETVLPITQAELGDALGLSNVHVNRVLQDFRNVGLLTWRGSTLHVRNWEGLREAGEFDETYLRRRG